MDRQIRRTPKFSGRVDVLHQTNVPAPGATTAAEHYIAPTTGPSQHHNSAL